MITCYETTNKNKVETATSRVARSKKIKKVTFDHKQFQKWLNLQK
jgi:hypothetical protein